MKNVPINPGWPRFARVTFVPAIRRGNLLFISGMTATDERTGAIVGTGDIVAQTRRIYEKMREVLHAAGATFENVVMTRDYITTTDGYRDTAAVRREFFGESFPAATGVLVNGLLREGALIEIEAVAILD